MLPNYLGMATQINISMSNVFACDCGDHNWRVLNKILETSPMIRVQIWVVSIIFIRAQCRNYIFIFFMK